MSTERLAAGRELRIEGDRAHYLRNVLRLREGAARAPVQRRGRRMAGDASPTLAPA